MLAASKYYFYPDYIFTSGYPSIDNVKSYQQNRSEFITKGSTYGVSFKTAVKECDDFVRDPKVRLAVSIILSAIENNGQCFFFQFQNYCSVELENIIVKEEPGYFVKRENGDHPQVRKIIKKRPNKTSCCAECAEKETKITDLLTKPI